MSRATKGVLLLAGAVLLALVACVVYTRLCKKGPPATVAGQPVLKIGVIGTMSGPAASWGLVCKRCAQVTADMYNEHGGVLIDGESYVIKLYVEDDRMDPKVSLAAAERLVMQEGIKYIIGPNVDDTTLSILPVTQAAGAMNFSYGFGPSIYTRPNGNSVVGMVATEQSALRLFQYLKKSRGVQKVAFLSLDSRNALNQLSAARKSAAEAGLTIVSSTGFDVSEEVYAPGATNVREVVNGVLPLHPDAVFLPGLTPADAPLVIKAIRDAGYKGVLAADTAQEATALAPIGSAANGFLSVGAALSGRKHSAYMEEFKKRYEALAGKWDDEAGTKAYALEMILRTLQVAGKGALQDVELFKQAIPRLDAPDPFVTDGRRLKYTGKSLFGQLRQFDLDVVVTEFRDGRFVPVYVGSVE